MEKLLCSYCSKETKLVNGLKIYPHRKDLAQKKFYLCEPCNAYVGCHPKTDIPLGRVADRSLRSAKMAAHSAFDPLWRSKKITRRGAYKWLAEKLEIDPNDCHIGMFDVEKCRKVVEACKSFSSGSMNK